MSNYGDFRRWKPVHDFKALKLGDHLSDQIEISGVVSEVGEDFVVIKSFEGEGRVTERAIYDCFTIYEVNRVVEVPVYDPLLVEKVLRGEKRQVLALRSAPGAPREAVGLEDRIWSADTVRLVQGGTPICEIPDLNSRAGGIECYLVRLDSSWPSGFDGRPIPGDELAQREGYASYREMYAYLTSQFKGSVSKVWWVLFRW